MNEAPVEELVFRHHNRMSWPLPGGSAPENALDT
jgi:hypothetical protein